MIALACQGGAVRDSQEFLACSLVSQLSRGVPFWRTFRMSRY